MDWDKAREKIRGPVASMITPLKEDYSVDVEGFRKNARFILENGYTEGNAVVMAATPGGESPSLNIEERKLVMTLLAEEAGRKVPIITSSHDCSLGTVLELTKYAHDLGYLAVQLQPPYYYGTSPDEVVDWYARVAREVDIGIMPYNTTWLGILDGVGFQEKLFERFAKIPNIIGIKWSSPKWETYIGVLSKYKDRFSFVDNQYKGLAVMFGAKALLAVVSNFHPRYIMDLWRLLKDKKFSPNIFKKGRDSKDPMTKHLETGAFGEAGDMFNKLTEPYYLWLRSMTKQGIHGEGPLVKAPMHLAGRPAGPAKPPYDHKLTPKQLAPLKKILLKAKVPGVK